MHGVPVTRTGVISRVRWRRMTLAILCHEQTFAGPKADLLRLWSACQANLSLIFAVYADATRTLDTLFAPILATPAAGSAALDGRTAPSLGRDRSPVQLLR